MSIRAIQARIDCNVHTLERLWHTHKVFNEKLPELLAVLFRMRRGECGTTKCERELYQVIGRFISARSSRDAWYLFNSISKKNWQARTAQKMTAAVVNPGGQEIEISGAVWAEKAAALTREGKFIYDKREMFESLPTTVEQMLCREVVAIISGHDELVKLWARQHEEWRKRRTEWEGEEEHKKYLALRQRFEDFEQEASGKVSKRRERWHKYLNWLRQHPELAAWRGGPAVINEISPVGADRILRAKPWNRNSAEANEFWKANPELKQLDRLHGYYEREFVRRRKQKRNPDGFDHPPTFTVPHPITHPRWFVFNARQTRPTGYRNLQVPEKAGAMGTIELRLVDQKTDGKPRDGWTQVRFKSDPRLGDFQSVKVHRPGRKGSIKGQLQERDEYQFLDRQLLQLRSARISGVRLILKQIRLNADGSLRSAVPYLCFACNVDNIPISENAKKLKWVASGGVSRTGKDWKTAIVPERLITCAVDLGIRHLGFATLAMNQDKRTHVLRSRNLWISQEEISGKHPGRSSAGPDLAHIARHRRKVRYLRRLRGAPVEGETSHVELQQHITNMGEDRFKKGARAIINFALNAEGAIDKRTGYPFPRADVLLLEKLTGLNPDAERERGINRALAGWNRGQLMKRVRQMAEDVGLRVLELSPFGTSQVCSRCGEVGRRYSILHDCEMGRPDVQFGWVERLFACRCGYRANADHNASVNLHRRFHLSESAVEAFIEFRGSSDKDMQKRIQALESDLLPKLRGVHRITPIPF